MDSESEETIKHQASLILELEQKVGGLTDTVADLEDTLAVALRDRDYYAEQVEEMEAIIYRAKKRR